MTPEEREALLARNPGLARAIARGVRSQRESLQASIGSPDQNAIEGPIGPTDPLLPPLANRMPGASTVTAFGQLGFSNIWSEERSYALQHATSDGYPFSTTSIPPGLNRPLTQAEADILNARYAP